MLVLSCRGGGAIICEWNIVTTVSPHFEQMEGDINGRSIHFLLVL